MSGQRPVPKMMHDVRIPVSEKWRSVKISGPERRRLERLREQLWRKHRNEVESAVEQASDPARSPIAERM